MRRTVFLVVAFFLLAAPAVAQIGKQPFIQAGTPEDKALLEIDNTPDSAKKLELLDKFLGEFGKGDMVLLAYERYMMLYAAEKNYPRVFEYGEKILALDPDSLATVTTLVRVAQEMSDTVKVFDYGERAGGILQRFKASPAPADTDADTWAQKKLLALERAGDQVNYIQYTAFSIASQPPDPAAKTALLERYVKAFPDSPYADGAQVFLAAMLILQADGWSEKPDQFDRAEEYAKRALDILDRVQKPAHLTDEQWAEQKPLQQGLAQSVIGQIQVRKGRNAQAVDALRAAGPSLKANPPSYARNQYWLGFALINLKRNAEARTAFAEAAAIDSPFKSYAQQKLRELGPAPPARKRRP